MNDFLENKLINLGIKNHTSSKPLANYVPCITSCGFLFVSGHLPIKDGEIIFPGKCNLDLSNEQMISSVKLATENMLWNISCHIKNENQRITDLKCCNLKGYINCEDKFFDHPSILNFSSDYIIKILGKDSGVHTRTAIGVNSLPLNSPIEIDGIFSIKFE